ncbi:aromatic amino acid transport family protein [Moritella sp. Urea-trap-13]|uniref:aromatic amino acid transport family protein n=1 Tax=Moritella sp. Urea-trap-13 TaxID=2058327 RepID=UPI000C33A47D|nr:aromatic amino acid transport family protein [Moritella sp. Urea-trap-13]PKH06745.1 tyrosine transporter TyrP [Moritella sp. Urea-trap-13]
MTSNKIVGSTLIVAGTALGGGMLALPLASAGLGFYTAAFLIIANWGLMTYTALLMLEIHQHAEQDATLNSLAKNLLGRPGQYLATFASFFLFYALCAAYIAGGGSQLTHKINELMSLELTPQFGAILLTIIVATVVSIGTHSVDIVNRVLFSVKIIVLALTLSLLFPHVEAINLLEMPVQQGLLLSALPVIFTSFGFHGSIPSIVRYVGIDIKTLKKVMICGASAPLVIYLLWQVATQGVLSQTDLMANNSLTSFIASLSSVLQQPQVSQSVSVFADLALATSFLGVSLGLFDLLSGMMKRTNSSINPINSSDDSSDSSGTHSGTNTDSKLHRVKTALVTFLPPLAFALFYPQGFIAALGYAAIALVILAIFLPVAMVSKQRKTQVSGYRVVGGNTTLVLASLMGCLIIASQFLQMADVIPAVG